MIHLYAFAHGLRSLPDRTGVEGERPDRHAFGSVTAVVGAVHGPPEDAHAAALAHGLLVESLLECADGVLPVRFGPPFASSAALEEAITPRLPELREQLLHVRGCVEVSVRIAAEAEARTPALDGAAYLRSRADATARREAAAEEAHGSLRALALDSRVDRLVHGDVLFDAAYLVRRSELRAFAQRVDDLTARRSDLRVLCTGPWAPASFAGEAA